MFLINIYMLKKHIKTLAIFIVFKKNRGNPLKAIFTSVIFFFWTMDSGHMGGVVVPPCNSNYLKYKKKEDLKGNFIPLKIP